MLKDRLPALETISMAAEGNHSSFTCKAMAYSAAGFLIALIIATKLLDTYFELTLLAETKG